VISFKTASDYILFQLEFPRDFVRAASHCSRGITPQRFAHSSHAAFIRATTFGFAEAMLLISVRSASVS
jgi:hypothetical protein